MNGYVFDIINFIKMRKWFDFSNQSYNEHVNMKDYTQKVST